MVAGKDGKEKKKEGPKGQIQSFRTKKGGGGKGGTKICKLVSPGDRRKKKNIVKRKPDARW